MAEGKKSFILYCDLIHNIDHLTIMEKGYLLDHLLQYVNDKNPVLEDRVLLSVWKPIERQLKRDLKRYSGTKIERSKAGILGNLKKHHPDLYQLVVVGKIELSEAQNTAKDRRIKAIEANTAIAEVVPQTPQPTANTAVNGNVNVNVNGNGINKKEIKKKVDIEKRKFDFAQRAYKLCSPQKEQIEMFEDFLGHWTEHGERDRKMRFEKQTSFYVKRRWGTWTKNQKKWAANKQNKPKRTASVAWKELVNNAISQAKNQ